MICSFILPLTEDFWVGVIVLAWDNDGDSAVIEAQEDSEGALIEPLPTSFLS